MCQRLIYVVGPSGAGKDSVLHTLRQTWTSAINAHWARRTITRPARLDGEQHEALDEAAFDQLQAQGAFGLYWEANALRYGVRAAELAPLDQGRCVFVNGSRGHLPTLLANWPRATVVLISAPPQVLAKRLAARGRETPQAIAARLEREVSMALPANHIAIQNDGPLQSAADALAQHLSERLHHKGGSAWSDKSFIR
jgi:ribose 1,5-bisphosphokinase